MRSGVVGTSSWKEAKWSSQCPSAIGCSKPSMLALLHDTAPLDRQLHSLHCFYLRTWTERDCGSHLLATKRPSDGGSRDLGRPRAVPLLKPRHMFCTLGMPTSVDSSLFEGPGDDVSRYMSLSVVCSSRACWTSTYRQVQHSKYSTCTYRRALPSGSRSCSCSCSIPLPALTLTLHPHLFLHSTSALHICMHVCRQGDISRFFFSWIVFV
jgi:hypothetical protein